MGLRSSARLLSTPAANDGINLLPLVSISRHRPLVCQREMPAVNLALGIQRLDHKIRYGRTYVEVHCGYIRGPACRAGLPEVLPERTEETSKLDDFRGSWERAAHSSIAPKFVCNVPVEHYSKFFKLFPS